MIFKIMQISIITGSRSEVTWVGGVEEWRGTGVTGKSQKGTLRGTRTFYVWIVVMITPVYMSFKTHQTVHFLYKVYLNKS